MLYGGGMNVPPEAIYLIRHAEKPLKPPLAGDAATVIPARAG